MENTEKNKSLEEMEDSTEIENSTAHDEDLQLAENKGIDNIEEDPKNTYDTKRESLNRTKIVKQTWSIQETYQKIKSGQLILDPGYQRNIVWKNDKKTAFIESLFMGILIPPIYVVEIPKDNMLEDNSYEVVDGKQRLSTINEFLQNSLALREKSLEYYTDWFANRKYEAIEHDYRELTRAMLSSVLDIYVITANSPEFTKYDIFSRLNKGAEKLKVNEIRKAIYHSSILLLVDKFVNNNIEDENGGDSVKYKKAFSQNDMQHYEDYGRFYRSIAFYMKSNITQSPCVVEGYNSRPRDMINNVLSDIQLNLSEIDKTKTTSLLEFTLDLKNILKGKTIDGEDYIIDSCVPFIENKDLLITKINDILNDTTVKNSLKKSPATTTNVNARLQRVKEILNQ